MRLVEKLLNGSINRVNCGGSSVTELSAIDLTTKGSAENDNDRTRETPKLIQIVYLIGDCSPQGDSRFGEDIIWNELIENALVCIVLISLCSDKDTIILIKSGQRMNPFPVPFPSMTSLQCTPHFAHILRKSLPN